MTATTTTDRAAQPPASGTYTVRIGGDCPFHGPHMSAACPDCAMDAAEASLAPELWIGGAR